MIFKTVRNFPKKLKKNFLSKEKYFSLTIILRRFKHLKIRKIFFVNHFTVKQMVRKGMNSCM
jgi:hypothetical protein